MTDGPHPLAGARRMGCVATSRLPFGRRIPSTGSRAQSGRPSCSGHAAQPGGRRGSGGGAGNTGGGARDAEAQVGWGAGVCHRSGFDRRRRHLPAGPPGDVRSFACCTSRGVGVYWAVIHVHSSVSKGPRRVGGLDARHTGPYPRTKSHTHHTRGPFASRHVDACT